MTLFEENFMPKEKEKEKSVDIIEAHNKKIRFLIDTKYRTDAKALIICALNDFVLHGDEFLQNKLDEIEQQKIENKKNKPRYFKEEKKEILRIRRSLKFPVRMIDQIYVLSNKYNISFNRIVNFALELALKNEPEIPENYQN